MIVVRRVESNVVTHSNLKEPNDSPGFGNVLRQSINHTWCAQDTAYLPPLKSSAPLVKPDESVFVPPLSTVVVRTGTHTDAHNCFVAILAKPLNRSSRRLRIVWTHVGRFAKKTEIVNL